VNDRCVLFFGDSFVAGAGDAEGRGWVGRLVAAAWTAGLAMTAYNLGVRGENTLDVARRFRREAEPRLIPDADNRVVFAVGANDVSVDAGGEMEVPTEDSLRLMIGLLDESEALGLTAMVLGPGPAGIPDHDERSRALGARFEELCAERRLAFIPILDRLLAVEDWTESAKRNDGLHPGAEGYEALARQLEPAWLEWLRT
jgi:acyl-CoA thioesterase I